MTDFLRDPPRWKERSDQARLAERAAGQMVRKLGTAEPLSDVQLARIAARVRAQRPHPHRLRFWVPATAVLLFGGVAAASAAHIDILPRWLIEIVRPGMVAPAPRVPAPRSPRLKSSSPAPAPARSPSPAPAPAVAAEQVPAVAVAPPVQPVPVPVPVLAQPSPGERAREPMRKKTFAPAEAKALELKPSQPAPMARGPVTAVPTQAPAVSGQPAPAPVPAVSGRPAPTQVSAVPGQWASTPAVSGQPAPAQPSALVQAPTAVWPVEPIARPQATQLAWVDQKTTSRRAEPARTIPETRSTLPAPANQGGGPMKYLSSAVHALRVEHSPAAALALLDRHAGDLEKSSVSHEALLLRVEAMLKLNRQTEVLQLLDTAPLAGVAASRTLLLTRGELRASAGRCAEAVSDFDLVLAQTQGNNKRALAGRAKCRK